MVHWTLLVQHERNCLDLMVECLFGRTRGIIHNKPLITVLNAVNGLLVDKLELADNCIWNRLVFMHLLELRNLFR